MKFSVLIFGLLSVLTLQQVSAYADDSNGTFSIPAQPVSSALEQFAEQSGLQLLYVTEAAQGFNTKGISGVYSNKEVLRKILENTNLEYEYVDDDTVAIRKRQKTGQSSKYKDGLLRLAQATNSNSTVTNDTGNATRSGRGTPGNIERNTNTGVGTLEEVVVTASKRGSQNLQDVALSIGTLSEEQLERAGFDNFSDYATSIAGISFADRGPGQQMIVIRGVSSSTSIVNADEPENKETVGIYVDEVPVSLNGFNPDLKLFDVERIEVVRGPQGTLYGAGSLSGTIRIITNKPDLEATDNKVSLTYSNMNDGGNNYAVNGMVNYPLIPGRLALRVVGYGRVEDGFIDNQAANDPLFPGFGTAADFQNRLEDLNEEDTFGGRAALTFQATDELSLTAKILHQDTELKGTQTEDNGLGDFNQNRVTPEPYFDEFTLYNLEARYDLGWASITSSTSYFDRLQTNDNEVTDFLAIPDLFGVGVDANAVPTVIRNLTDVEDFVQEIRIVSTGDGPFEWMAGFFYNQQDKVFTQDVPAPGFDAVNGPLFAALGITSSGDVGTAENLFESTSIFDERQIAVFGEIAYNINERLKIIAGARWFDFDQSFEFRDNQGLFAAGLQFNNELKEDGINPKFSVEYRPKDDLLIYATASQGFRLGGPNDPLPNFCDLSEIGLSGPAPADFESDSLWSYEGGVKTSLSGGRINISGAGYFIEWDDIPIAQQLSCGFAPTINAGSVEVIGTEFEGSAAVTDNFNISGSVSYIDSSFAEDQTVFNVREGDRTPVVPRWTVGVSALYTFPIPAIAGWQGYISGNYRYRTSSFNVADPTIRLEQPAFDSLNLRFGVQSDRWEITAFVENVWNERGVLFIDTQLGENRASVNDPRTIGVNFISRF